MRIDLEALIYVDFIITTSIMQSADERMSVECKQEWSHRNINLPVIVQCQPDVDNSNTHRLTEGFQFREGAPQCD